ncbi:MAG: hypothetical protein HYZ28_16495 [Myxococcales bacterium]|nr:hypothetical protein [Myxococcales bacterium]
MNSRFLRLAYGAALLIAVLPLWAGRHLPFVDLPQHLHLISVLHRLDDPTTLYPELFELRGQLTPYLGYYYAVSLLNWLLPLEAANRVFLSAYVAGLPLSLAFLLRSFRRPAWPALLALPFAYGDSLAWGFLNYCSALPLAFLACGLFARAIADPPRRLLWAIGLGLCLLAVLLFHVQVFAYLGVALPFLLATTSAPEDPGATLSRRLAARRHALAAVVPAAALFLFWVGLRLGAPTEVQYGAPWKAWGPLLSKENLSFNPFEQNLAQLPRVLANMLRDGTDRYGLYAALAVAALALAAALVPRWRAERAEGPVERFRMLGLAAIALLLYFALPFDIRGYMYYLNTRFAHLAAPLVLACVPALRPEAQRTLTALAAAASLALGIPLARGFAEFDREASALDELSMSTGHRPKVMGLIYDTSSRAVGHPVFLHASTVLARAKGGATNFSFALTPHSPLKYRGSPPPTFPSEWRPDQLDYRAQGGAYDHFVLRGAHPAQVFGPLLSSELYVAAQSEGFWLVRRR